METKTFTLPAYWASYLINGDASGISAEDKAQCDAFLTREELNRADCATCSDEQWFARSNDAGTLAGDVLEYTFLVRPSADLGLLKELLAGPRRACRGMTDAERLLLREALVAFNWVGEASQWELSITRKGRDLLAESGN